MENVVSMEEVRSKKLVRKEAGQPSGGHDQLIEESEKLSIVIHERVGSTPSSSMEQKFQSLEEAAGLDGKAGSKPRIQRVPFMLQDNQNFKKYCAPRVVSIGPLHHGNLNLRLAKKLKLRLAGLFIKQHGLQKEDVFRRIKNDLKKLKECYDEEEIKKYDDENLTWMFFVDGCAVLHFIDCVVADDHGEKLKELNIKNDHIAFAQLDLFLLENQLPYQVLEVLMTSKAETEKLRDSINKFIDNNIIRAHKKQENQHPQPQLKQQEEPTHLLDLLRKRLLHPSETHSFIKRQLQKCMKCFPKPKGKKTHNWHSFRNVKELKAAGIWFRPSKTSFLTDISFLNMILFAKLKLPPLRVDDGTAPKFLNLIAYDMCPEFVNDFGVTSYVYFLDSLIDQAEDVKELRKAHILHNALGSDEDVATLFNQICTDLVPNPDTYENVKEHIQNHCDSKWKPWIAQFYHDHFTSPWTSMAFLGVLIGLAFSFFQAWDPMLQFFHYKSCNST